MLTRSIDIDPFDLTTREKFLRGAKRICSIVAIGALMLGMLDLMNVRSLESAAELFHADRQRVAGLLDLIRTGIQSTALASPSAFAVATIPRGDIAMTPRRARDLDAVEVALAAPVPLVRSEPPTAAMPAMPPSPAERLHLEGAARAKAERCLAEAIYFEARDDTERGQAAVAQVVMNRVFARFYPNDVCGVVYQNANRHRACQFSFACSGKRRRIDERDAWALANRIARETLDGKLYVPAVGASTHFHAVNVRPNWVREMRKVAHYGIHDFYRPIAWGDGADEPVWGTAAMVQVRKK